MPPLGLFKLSSGRRHVDPRHAELAGRLVERREILAQQPVELRLVARQLLRLRGEDLLHPLRRRAVAARRPSRAGAPCASRAWRPLAGPGRRRRSRPWGCASALPGRRAWRSAPSRRRSAAWPCSSLASSSLRSASWRRTVCSRTDVAGQAGDGVAHLRGRSGAAPPGPPGDDRDRADRAAGPAAPWPSCRPPSAAAV